MVFVILYTASRVFFLSAFDLFRSCLFLWVIFRASNLHARIVILTPSAIRERAPGAASNRISTKSGSSSWTLCQHWAQRAKSRHPTRGCSAPAAQCSTSSVLTTRRTWSGADIYRSLVRVGLCLVSCLWMSRACLGVKRL